MNDFKILSDSCSDIPDDLLKKYDVDIIPFYTCLDGQNHLKERFDISIDDFYNHLEIDKGLFPKTSFPAISEYIDFFRPYLEKNMDIIYISMTSKFSGAYSAITNMVENLKNDYQSANLIILDSMQVSMGEGLLIIEAAKMKNAGHSIFEVADFINQTKLDSKLFCTVNSLSYLQKGGRIGKVSAIAGSLFNIKPIIAMKDGELYPHSKIRGRKKAIEEMIRLIVDETQSEKENFEYAVFHSCSHNEAIEIINTMCNDFGININLPPVKVGVIIGSHIGPTVLAVAAVKKFSKMNLLHQ